MGDDITAGRHGGNAESAEANDSIAAVKPTLRKRVVEYVRSRGTDGATSDEIEVALGMRHQTASARITEAKQLGLLEKTGTRRPTRSGHSAAVLVAVAVCEVCGEPAAGTGHFITADRYGTRFEPCGHLVTHGRGIVYVGPVDAEPDDWGGWTEIGYTTEDGVA